jgi:hypothetical protein
MIQIIFGIGGVIPLSISSDSSCGSTPKSVSFKAKAL